MKTFLFLALLFAQAVPAAEGEDEKKIYKYKDADGVIHYTENPPGEDYQEADLPQLNVMPADDPPPATRAPANRTTSNSSVGNDAGDGVMYARFRITSPQAEENIWGSGGSLSASVDFKGQLAKNHQIQFVVDGKPQPPERGKTQTLGQIARGTHTLQAQIVQQGGGAVMVSTRPITFYMHQHSKK